MKCTVLFILGVFLSGIVFTGCGDDKDEYVDVNISKSVVKNIASHVANKVLSMKPLPDEVKYLPTSLQEGAIYVGDFEGSKVFVVPSEYGTTSTYISMSIKKMDMDVQEVNAYAVAYNNSTKKPEMVHFIFDFYGEYFYEMHEEFGRVKDEGVLGEGAFGRLAEAVKDSVF